MQWKSDQLTVDMDFNMKPTVHSTAHWGKSQPQLSGASIWGDFFESLKQDFRIIEFKNQV